MSDTSLPGFALQEQPAHARVPDSPNRDAQALVLAALRHLPEDTLRMVPDAERIPSPPQRRRTGTISRVLDFLPIFCVVAVAGMLLRDRSAFSTIAYYVPPLATVLGALLWLLLQRQRRPAWLRWIVVACAATAGWKMVVVDAEWNEPTMQPPPHLRLVHWNTARGVFGRESILRDAADAKPDICLLSEPPQQLDPRTEASRIIDAPHVFDELGLALISRYPIRPLDRFRLSGVRGWFARLDTPHGPLDVMAVDVVSSPFRSRGPILAALLAKLESHDSDVPLILAGDFNTPRDSVHFDRLRDSLSHAYERAGRGWPYTWPTPLPIYAIDHVWTSRGVRVCRYELVTSAASDHRMQVVDLRIESRGPAR